MDFEQYLKVWLKPPIQSNINPLKQKGFLFKVFPHLENICSKSANTFYKNEVGLWEEVETYKIFASEQDSPADLFLNWILDIEKVPVTSLQVILFNKLFGLINTRENVFTEGVPLNYFSQVLANLNYNSLQNLKYYEEIEGIVAVIPYYYYDPTPFDSSEGIVKDKVRCVKTMKIFSKTFFNTFLKDAKYRDKVLSSHYFFSNSGNYKSSFEASGLFTTKPLEDVSRIMKAIENSTI